MKVRPSWQCGLVLAVTTPSSVDAWVHPVLPEIIRGPKRRTYRHILLQTPNEKNVHVQETAGDATCISTDRKEESMTSSSNAQHLSMSRRISIRQMTRNYVAALWGVSSFGLLPARAAALSDATVELCQTGALMTEQAITGAYEQECMKLSVREIPYQNTRQNRSGILRIQQGTAGAGSTGLAVWNSSLLLSRLLQQLASASDDDWPSSRTRVLELGCGTGLASLTAAALGADQVLATDGNPAVVSLAERNIRTNDLSDRVRARGMTWSFMNALEYADEMDVVMGSDLTYQSQNWPALAETMATAVKPRVGLVLYLTLGHAGFAVQAEVQGFLAVAQQYGLVPVVDAPATGLPTSDLTRFVYEHCIRPEELPIVQSTGGVRVLALQRKR